MSILTEQEDGTYALVKGAFKQTIKMYRTVEEEDEEDGDDEGDDDDEWNLEENNFT